MHQVGFGAREEVEESLACAAGLANDDDDDRVSENRRMAITRQLFG